MTVNPAWHLNLNHIIGKIQGMCTIQFVGTSYHEVSDIRKQHVGIPNLGGSDMSASDSYSHAGTAGEMSPRSEPTGRPHARPRSEEEDTDEQERPHAYRQIDFDPQPEDLDPTVTSHDIQPEDVAVPDDSGDDATLWHMPYDEEEWIIMNDIDWTYFNVRQRSCPPDPEWHIGGDIVLLCASSRIWSSDVRELEMSHQLSMWIHGLPRPLCSSEYVVLRYDASGSYTAVIE
eukprot:4346214-Karenia_brevis.AAC.1